MKKYLLFFSVLLAHQLTHAAWGAIAFDVGTGSYGLSQGGLNQQQAEANAIAACNAANCKIFLVSEGGFLAIATSNHEKGWAGFGKAATESEAMYNAMYYCNTGTYSCTLKSTEPTQ